MYEVTVSKLRFSKDKVLVSGDPVDIQDKNLAAKLMRKGYVKIAADKSKKIVSVGASNSGSNPDPYAEKNAKEMAELIAGIEDIEELKKLLDYEQQNKKRKTVLEAISVRAEELTENDGDDDGEGAGSSVDLKLNPDDMIVS